MNSSRLRSLYSPRRRESVLEMLIFPAVMFLVFWPVAALILNNWGRCEWGRSAALAGVCLLVMLGLRWAFGRNAGAVFFWVLVLGAVGGWAVRWVLA